jgi:hypothetical protein
MRFPAGTLVDHISNTSNLNVASIPFTQFVVATLISREIYQGAHSYQLAIAFTDYIFMIFSLSSKCLILKTSQFVSIHKKASINLWACRISSHVFTLVCLKTNGLHTWEHDLRHFSSINRVSADVIQHLVSVSSTIAEKAETNPDDESFLSSSPIDLTVLKLERVSIFSELRLHFFRWQT